MKALALAAVLGLTGCFLPDAKDPNVVTFHADRDFTDVERQCLVEAADKVAEQTSGLVNIEVEFDYNVHSTTDTFRHRVTNRIVRWTSSTPEVLETDAALTEEHGTPWKLMGQTNGVSIFNVLRRPIEVRLVADRLPTKHICILTAMHEFGHALGVGHLESSKGNIMYPSVEPERSACFKAADLGAFCERYGCRLEDMKPCPDEPPASALPSTGLICTE